MRQGVTPTKVRGPVTSVATTLEPTASRPRLRTKARAELITNPPPQLHGAVVRYAGVDHAIRGREWQGPSSTWGPLDARVTVRNVWPRPLLLRMRSSPSPTRVGWRVRRARVTAKR